ncbi:methyltransferase [Luteibacter aegosomaticola]|uniref:methyltransferase n=1 Tax=Luteibacter aegosomaticola TaxID=2911538 RepID=UPI001FF8FEDF|nr:methyltransferase [Luteibacter aegosomaticola]UPG88622.1 methyltransferase [Luteibacter aegosomaticola]
MPAPSSKTYDSQSVYSPATLAIYDTLVLRLSNPLVWRCPTGRILDLYNKHVTDAHLDVGVGTGWYMDHCRFPAPPRLALMDLNPNALAAAARRVERYAPSTHVADVLKPIEGHADTYGSIGVTYLLHCLAGDIRQKAVVFDHLIPLLAPGGTVFGATILAQGVPRSGAAQKLMGFYNKKGIFGNARDSLDDLRLALASRFNDVRVDTIGCVALFSAKSPSP